MTDIPSSLPEKYHARWQWLHESLSASAAFDVELSKDILRDLAAALKRIEELERTADNLPWDVD